MGRKICLIILLELCFCWNLAFAEGTVISIAEQARVDGAIITLGDLAEITGADAEKKQRLRQLRLGNAPLPGSSLVLTKEILDMRLAATGTDLSGITWQVPSSITITSNSQQISGQILTDKAIAAIRSQIGPNVSNEDLSIAAMGARQDIAAPVGKVTINTSLPYGVRYNTPTTVTMVVSVNEREFTKVGLKFDVKLYRQVAVAARQISAREILTDDNLRFQRMDVGKLGTGYYTDKNRVLGLMVRRQLTPGIVLIDSMVNKPAIVKRGSVVTLVARIGSMEVTATGQAMQDGIEGQLIRVQNANSNKIVLGKVLDESTIQVLTYKSASRP